MPRERRDRARINVLTLTLDPVDGHLPRRGRHGGAASGGPPPARIHPVPALWEQPSAPKGDAVPEGMPPRRISEARDPAPGHLRRSCRCSTWMASRKSAPLLRNVDLNRDWLHRSAGTRAIVQAVRKWKPDLIMDLHELHPTDQTPSFVEAMERRRRPRRRALPQRRDCRGGRTAARTVDASTPRRQLSRAPSRLTLLRGGSCARSGGDATGLGPSPSIGPWFTTRRSSRRRGIWWIRLTTPPRVVAEWHSRARTPPIARPWRSAAEAAMADRRGDRQSPEGPTPAAGKARKRG